jgi:CRISPR/Cas system Type II protein with McrA/HNH and RuvC-like nuclease domain
MIGEKKMIGNSESPIAQQNPISTLTKAKRYRGLTREQINALGPLTFGFDIGIASVGWAVLSETRIVDLGVRCFDAAEDPKEKISLNQARRAARVSRNRFAQRRSRLKRLKTLFEHVGLLPRSAIESLFAPVQAKGVEVDDLWEIRSNALIRALTNEEFAHVLHHLVKRRGYGSLREAQDRAKEDSDGGKNADEQRDPESATVHAAPVNFSPPSDALGKPLKFGAAVDDNAALLDELIKTYITVGHAVWTVSQNGFKPTNVAEVRAKARFSIAKRNHNDGYARLYVRRQLRDEIKQLFAHQRKHNNAIADAAVPSHLPAMTRVQVGAGQPRPVSRAFEDQVLAFFDEQYPPIVAAHMEQLVGKCELEADEPRAPRESFSSERSKWLQTLNRLEVVRGDGKKPDRLNDRERKAVLNLPYEKAEVTYKDLRTVLCEQADWPQDWRLMRFAPLTYRSVTMPGSDQIKVVRGDETVSIKDTLPEGADKKAKKAIKEEFERWLTTQANAGPITLAALRARLALPNDQRFEIKKKSSQRILPIDEADFVLPQTGNTEHALPRGFFIKCAIVSSARAETLPAAAMQLLASWPQQGERKSLANLRNETPSSAWPQKPWQFIIEQNSPPERIAVDAESTTILEQRYSDAQDVENERVITLKGWHKIKRALETKHPALWAELSLAMTENAETPDAARRVDDIFDALAYNFTDDEIRKSLTKCEPPIDDEAINSILNIVSSGFGHLSYVALRAIRPKLEEGLVYSDACAQCERKYDHSGAKRKREATEYLAPLETFQFRRISVRTGEVKKQPIGKDPDGTLRFRNVEEKRYVGLANPVVARSFNQARKVLNALISVYGSPAYVAIETGRELSKPGKVRKQIEADNKARNQSKEAARKEFVSDHSELARSLREAVRGGDKAIDRVMRILRMREEQGQKCMYSGRAIDYDQLLKSLTPGTESKYVEIDHVIPRSRSADNSLDNQVLVLATENQTKGNRTPFEWHGKSDPAWWHRFKVTVNALPLMSDKKKAKLLLEEFDEEEFVGRNLVDTQYATRLFARMLREGLLFRDGVHAEEPNLSPESTSRERWDNLQRARVRTPQGAVTAMLRGLWGLSKNREISDLHHAVDACVVAATTPRLIQRVNEYNRFSELVSIGPNGRAFWRSVNDKGENCAGVELTDSELAVFRDKEFPEAFAPNRFHQEVLARVSADGRTYSTKHGRRFDYSFANYEPEASAAIAPAFVSRGRKLIPGEVHKQTVWSIRDAELGRRRIYVHLSNLTESQYEDAVGKADPRNFWLFEEINRRLKAETGTTFDVRAKKAFKEPILKPSHTGTLPHRIRRIRIEEKLKPSVSIRGGAAELGEMNAYRLGLDCEGKFAFDPRYSINVKEKTPQVSDLKVKIVKEKPLRSLSGNHHLVLRKNDYLVIEFAANGKKRLAPIEGYLHQYESDGRLTLRRHDQVKVENSGEHCHYRSKDWSSAVRIQFFRVTILGERTLFDECAREVEEKAPFRRRARKGTLTDVGKE